MPTHTATYLYEPDSFIPLAQLTAGFDRTALAATGTDRQPLRCYQAQTAQLYYFQTDHLGTPQDITDTEGHIVWSGQYREGVHISMSPGAFRFGRHALVPG